MKKHLFTLVITLISLAIFTSNVLAAPAICKSAALLRTSYEATGITLLFTTKGVTKDEVKNVTFFADSQQKGITCNFLSDGTTVRCTVDKSLANHGQFRVILAGMIFSGDLPDERDFSHPTLT